MDTYRRHIGPNKRRLGWLALWILLLGLPLGTAQATGWETGKFGDQGDGTYANPILPGDFQNTDVVRVGGDYYYISATKAMSPGMLVLHSKDLVNWQAIGHVIPDITQFSPRFNYDRMEGIERGVWAGAIAHHDKRFYVYFTTPDEGLYVSTAQNPAGPWSPLTCLIGASGWDDPCPFWDDNGQAYLVTTNFALDPKNGKTYNIHLFQMSADGLSLRRDTDTIIHQSQGSEASKLFKRSGYYYHFYSQVTKEGRVPMMERARVITGPYETRQISHVNRPTDREPNQGTILQTAAGQWVFITHHGVSDWEGRPASLLPVTWVDGWPVPGQVGPDGIGSMVWFGKKPIAVSPAATLQTDDEFNRPQLGPQWEWYFQPRADKWSLTERPGFLRLYAFKPLQPGSLLKTGNILTQRLLRAAYNAASIRLDISHMADGQVAGLCLLGRRFGAVAVSQDQGTKRFVANDTGAVTAGSSIPATTTSVWLRAVWNQTGTATFGFSLDGKTFTPLGSPFQITNFGSFLGAKIGVYTANDRGEFGYVDVDAFHYSYSQSSPGSR